MSIKEIIRESLELDKLRLIHYERIAKNRVIGRLNSRWDRRRSSLRYYFMGPNDKEEHPLPLRPNSNIWKLQCKRFAEEMIRVLKSNISAKEACLSSLQSDDPVDILENMPRSYRPNQVFRPHKDGHDRIPEDTGIRNDLPSQNIPQSENPYKREQLTIETSFGLVVRTKGELLIAELLYSLGIEFFYERALVLDVRREELDIISGKPTGRYYWDTKTYYPDFTIVLPGGNLFFWEHKGLMTDRSYVERDIQKTIDYNMNGIYQTHNYAVTEEGPNNAIDFEGIKLIAKMILVRFYHYPKDDLH